MRTNFTKRSQSDEQCNEGMDQSSELQLQLQLHYLYVLLLCMAWHGASMQYGMVTVTVWHNNSMTMAWDDGTARHELHDNLFQL